jgi:alpha-L-rhamnosidase
VQSDYVFSPDARWIWGESAAEGRNAWRYFRCVFDAPESLRRAILYITADSRYECRINGAHIGRGPIRGFPFAYFFDHYDLTPYLHPGEQNVAAVLVNALGDHTMTYIKGRAGLLCEIVLEDNAGNRTLVSSGASWKTQTCSAFNQLAPRISVQLDFEEQYDARREIAGWDSIAFDDSSWTNAVEIGAVGCAPWTSLSASPIPLLTENPVSPTAVKAVELVRLREGYVWNLDLRDQLGTMRTGLRSAPPGERGSIIFTEVFVPRECRVMVHRFPNYEPIIFRVNDQIFNPYESETDAEEPVEVHLRQGANLFMLREVEWPAFLIETDETLVFSAERFAPDAAWVVIPGLNELAGEVNHYWAADTLDDLSTTRQVGIPASANKTDIFALTASQLFYSIEGGFGDYDITRATPRPKLTGVRPQPALSPTALLHDNNEWTSVQPQPDGDVHVLLDFGREIIGYLRLHIDAPEGAIIDANCFEGIDDTGIFWTANLRNSFRYLCREGNQVFTSHQRRGFRYASLTFRNLSRPLKIRHVDTLMSTYPVEARGHFACSDTTLNKIWEVGAYTVQLCMLDTYVDCPAYEQVYWVGDARNSALVNAVAFGAYDLTERCIRLTGQSLARELDQVKPPHLQRPHITTSHVVSGWFDEIPMWTFLWVWMAWEQFWHTGDRDALADYYADVRECLRRSEGFLTARDLLDIPDVWNLVDWAAQDLERDGEVISNTALMAQALDYAARMADALNLPQEAAAHNTLAARLRTAINLYGWSDTYQGYVDTVRDETAYRHYQDLCQSRGTTAISWEDFQQKQRISEPTNTLVLLCNAVPADHYESVMRFVLAAREGKFVGGSPPMARLGDTDSVVPVGSPWFLFFTLETLFREGYSGDALTILREQWNRMLEKGATTFWETFPGFIGSGHWSRSLCHGWSAAPTYFLSTQVLGVTPLAPGYERIRIAPQRYHLTWASGVVPTPRGDISVAWRLDEAGQMRIEYDVPDGCEVEVLIS